MVLTGRRRRSMMQVGVSDPHCTTDQKLIWHVRLRQYHYGKKNYVLGCCLTHSLYDYSFNTIGLLPVQVGESGMRGGGTSAAETVSVSVVWCAAPAAVPVGVRTENFQWFIQIFASGKNCHTERKMTKNHSYALVGCEQLTVAQLPALVVAQLAEWSLPIPDIWGSNLAIGT